MQAPRPESGASPSSRRGGRAWLAVGTALALGTAIGSTLDPGWLDWQPGLAATEPWRWWSAAFVHWSALHVAANLAGLALVCAYGWYAGLPQRAAFAWLLAWPMTQLGLLARPELAHYGGLSGVLHAGLTVASLWLVISGSGRRRFIGSATLMVLAIKVIGESPWGPALRFPAGWDIGVVPLAHASGFASGVLATLLAFAWPGNPPPGRHGHA